MIHIRINWRYYLLDDYNKLRNVRHSVLTLADSLLYKNNELGMKCVSFFSTNLFEVSSVLIYIEQVMFKMYAEMHINPHIKYLLLLSNFNCNLLVNLSKPLLFQISWNYVQLIGVLLKLLTVDCHRKSYYLRNNEDRHTQCLGVMCVIWQLIY